MQKKGPMLLIVSLIVILVFIVGVRYGQRVEKTNKQTAAVLSIPPTKVPPTQAPITFKTYSGKACGAQFLYPSSLDVAKESSTSMQLVGKNKIMLDVVCDASPSSVPKDRILNNKLNPQTGKQVYFVISEDILPLLNTSLKFIFPKSAN